MQELFGANCSMIFCHVLCNFNCSVTVVNTFIIIIIIIVFVVGLSRHIVIHYIGSRILSSFEMK